MPDTQGPPLLRIPKKLILCCDGTWMDSDNGWVRTGLFGQSGYLQTPTNVTRLTRAVKAEDSAKHPQIVYYQAGLGTGLGLWDQFAGGGTGAGFSENIREAYSFLANNYAPGDSVFLTGFSRGAYTARSLSGLVSQLGLIKKESMHWFPYIFMDWQNAGSATYEPQFFKQYRDQVTVDKPLKLNTPSNDRKILGDYLDEYRNVLLGLDLTQEVYIKAVGVWDTVGALGIPINPWLSKIFRLPSFLHDYKWVDTSLDRHIDNAFQALALDEHRAPFLPALWERYQEKDDHTNLKQCWFPGAHSNVGGSYRDIATANITLAWMMDQLAGNSLKESSPNDWKEEDWIEFDRDYLMEQWRLNDQWQKKHSRPHVWGTGTIYNSFTFPQAMAGHRTRKPGRTHPTILDGDFIDPNRLMTDTKEYIHASVRARIDLGGRSYESDPEATLPSKVTFKIWSSLMGFIHKILGREGHHYYQSKALDGWALRDGHGYHDELAVNAVDLDTESDGQPPYWEWQGKDDPLVSQGKQIPEDRLGTFEKDLLRQYEQVAVAIEATNLGVKPVDILKEHDVRRGSTRKASTM